MRVRKVKYSPGYQAQRWCTKVHLLLCVSGVLRTECADGRIVVFGPGAGYKFGDDGVAHRSSTRTGATLFILE